MAQDWFTQVIFTTSSSAELSSSITSAATLSTSSSSSISSSSQTRFQQAMPYAFTIIGFLGMSANLFVLVVIATSRSLKKRQENSLIFNQSLIDCLSGFFLILTVTTSQTNMHYSGVWGEIVCRVWVPAAPLWATLQASIFGLLVITLERYMEIVHPIYYKVKRSGRVMWLMVLSPWILALVVSIHVSIFKNGVSSSGQCLSGSAWPSAAAMMANGIINLSFKYLLPVPTFIYCYARMFVSLKKNIQQPIVPSAAASKVENKQTSSDAKQGTKLTVTGRARRNVIKTLLCVIVVHTLCWTMNQVLYMANMFGMIVDRSGPLYVMSVVIVYVHCCVNPVIYTACYTAFKQDIFRRLGWTRNKIMPLTSGVVVDLKSTASA